MSCRLRNVPQFSQGSYLSPAPIKYGWMELGIDQYIHTFLFSYILVKQQWRQHSLLRSPAIWYLSPGTLRTSPAFCGACFYILNYCWCIQLIGVTNATEYQGMNLTWFAARWLANEERNVTCFKQAFVNYLFQARFCALKISTINETKLAPRLAAIKYLEDLRDNNLDMLFY